MATPAVRAQDNPHSKSIHRQLNSVLANAQDNTLHKAFERMKELQSMRTTHTARTLEELLESIGLTPVTEVVSNLNAPPPCGLDLAPVLQKTGPETVFGLSKSEAAALLLCTAEDGYTDGSVYAIVKEIFPQKAEQCMVLVATLVSALRKLREHSAPVHCVRACDAHVVHRTDETFVVCGFLHATCNLDSGDAGAMLLIPHKRRAAVLPECFTRHSKGCDVIFEPGTAFRRIVKGVFAELPPVDPVPACVPEVQTFYRNNTPEWDTLVPPQQCVLLFPQCMRLGYLPSEKPTDGPCVCAAAAAAAAAAQE